MTMTIDETIELKLTKLKQQKKEFQLELDNMSIDYDNILDQIEKIEGEISRFCNLKRKKLL